MKQPVFRKFKSTGVTAAFLTLAMGGAVYLNWNYARALPAEAQTVGAAAEKTAAVTDPLLPAAADADAGNTAKNYGEAQLVSVVKDAGTSFFESARLSRDKARDEALETLKKALKNAKLTDEEKTALTEKLSAQVSSITAAAELESLIKAKGFADCLVALDETGASVTVMTETGTLNGDQVARIRDAVLTKCPQLSAQQLTIVEVK